ncbi:hypothetical protein C8J57DRAFT_1262387 [Mycena rebaudengoi]|nr:hypothetical protein C8J57DRAFT_1262387 [Mycena rebaudengoi]
MPSRVVEVVQRAVTILLKNMAELGRASIRFGNFRNTLGTGHFVPCQATMVFFLAEFFVDRVGFEGDGDVLRRNFLFRELSTLFDVMVTHPKYCELRCDFPGFPIPRGDLRRVGHSPDIKKKQQQGLLVQRGEIRRGFGERLMRYNPQLSDFYVHRIALPELVVTRPNTPEMEDGEISGNDALLSLANVPEDTLMGEAGNFPIVASAKIERAWEYGGRDDDVVDEFEVVLYNPRPVEDVVLYARKPEEFRDIPLIFQLGSALSDLSLAPSELEDPNFVPPEKWPSFFELRLRPMVYILHRAVMHDFTLVGRYGEYSRLELDEHRWWLSQVLWHCHLVIRNMHTTALPYLDEDAPPFPPPIEIPGESTAMFEIVLKICLSLGFPTKSEHNADLIQNALAPLIAVARKTKLRFGTPNDYYPFKDHGDVLVDDYLDPSKGRLLGGVPVILECCVAIFPGRGEVSFQGIVPRGVFLSRCPAACSLFRNDIRSIGSPPSEFHPISPPVASGSVALNRYPIMPVSGTVTLWRIASIPRGVLATHRRLSLKGYLLQMDLFPNRESEGVFCPKWKDPQDFLVPGQRVRVRNLPNGEIFHRIASPAGLVVPSSSLVGGTSKCKPKPKAKDAPPSRAVPTSGAIPHPTPAYRKHKLASLSPAASPAPASSRTISQVAAMPDSQASSKHQRLDLLPPLLRALTIGETNVHHGHFVDLTPERLGFDPIRTETASPPESEARTDEELFAAGARLLDEELAPFCGPAYYGLRDFTCPATYDILQPAFERGIALGLLVMCTRRWLDSLAYFNYHRPKLVDPLDMEIPPDDQLVPRAAFVQPDVAVAQTFPVPAGASVEEEEEIRERNREQTRLAVRINREHNEAAEEAYAAANAQRVVDLQQARRDFEAEHLRTHKRWACYEEDRVVFLHQYVIISNTFLSYASWHHSTTVSASSACASTSTKPTVANPPVTVHEIADTESSREGSQYGDSDSDQLDEGEDEVDPPVSAKAAGKRRARVSGGNNDWSKFEEEKCGYMLVGSRVKQAADSVDSRRKAWHPPLDDDEWNHLAFLLEERVWEITGPHLLPPPRDLTAKPAVTPNGYFLSLSNPKYVAGLERYHIQPAHFGALSYFVHGQGCTQCCDDDEPCIRIFKGHQLNRGCTTCAIRNWSCIAVMPFSDVDWARTDDYLQDINVEFFLYQQARAAQVFQCVTGMKYSNVAYNTARPLFGGDEGVIAIPEVNEKGERVFSIAPLSDGNQTRRASLAPQTRFVHSAG